jgi:hypothetical protein
MISGLFDLLLASILTTSYEFRRGRTLTVRKLKKLDASPADARLKSKARIVFVVILLLQLLFR